METDKKRLDLKDVLKKIPMREILRILGGTIICFSSVFFAGQVFYDRYMNSPSQAEVTESEAEIAIEELDWNYDEGSLSFFAISSDSHNPVEKIIVWYTKSEILNPTKVGEIEVVVGDARDYFRFQSDTLKDLSDGSIILLDLQTTDGTVYKNSVQIIVSVPSKQETTPTPVPSQQSLPEESGNFFNPQSLIN